MWLRLVNFSEKVGWAWADSDNVMSYAELWQLLGPVQTQAPVEHTLCMRCSDGMP